MPMRSKQSQQVDGTGDQGMSCRALRAPRWAARRCQRIITKPTKPSNPPVRHAQIHAAGPPNTSSANAAANHRTVPTPSAGRGSANLRGSGAGIRHATALKRDDTAEAIGRLRGGSPGNAVGTRWARPRALAGPERRPHCRQAGGQACTGRLECMCSMYRRSISLTAVRRSAPRFSSVCTVARCQLAPMRRVTHRCSITAR